MKSWRRALAVPSTAAFPNAGEWPNPYLLVDAQKEFACMCMKAWCWALTVPSTAACPTAGERPDLSLLRTQLHKKCA
eukprot:1157733-Pelagomonas_calceolata.AAC.3